MWLEGLEDEYHLQPGLATSPKMLENPPSLLDVSTPILLFDQNTHFPSPILQPNKDVCLELTSSSFLQMSSELLGW